MREYKCITLPNGEFIQVKFDVEGVVYDRFSSTGEHLESYGYDFYGDILHLSNPVEFDDGEPLEMD